jgi:hypothetical protein
MADRQPRRAAARQCRRSQGAAASRRSLVCAQAGTSSSDSAHGNWRGPHERGRWIGHRLHGAPRITLVVEKPPVCDHIRSAYPDHDRNGRIADHNDRTCSAPTHAAGAADRITIGGPVSGMGMRRRARVSGLTCQPSVHDPMSRKRLWPSSDDLRVSCGFLPWRHGDRDRGPVPCRLHERGREQLDPDRHATRTYRPLRILLTVVKPETDSRRWSEGRLPLLIAPRRAGSARDARQRRAAANWSWWSVHQRRRRS